MLEIDREQLYPNQTDNWHYFRDNDYAELIISTAMITLLGAGFKYEPDTEPGSTAMVYDVPTVWGNRDSYLVFFIRKERAEDVEDDRDMDELNVWQIHLEEYNKLRQIWEAMCKAK